MASLSFIYREYSCSLSRHNCTKLLRSLALTKSCITCMFTTASPETLPAHTVGRWSVHFKLRFTSQKDLDEFHALGFETTEPTVPRL